ncbi:hypothetical protein SDC9_52235 [bioreactor metagenome]|jgi:hypothetical protein|uniref:Uncharacterized protein n=1 Tax=bioreactor metagenome TaxID=1076179 RepID=A0A644WQ44_9ZZZZ
MIKNKRIIKGLELFAYLILISTIINLGSISSSDNIYFYILSSFSLIISFILSLTQGFFKKYSSSVISYVALVLIIMIVEFFANEFSFTIILLNIVASTVCLTFYKIEKDRKEVFEDSQEQKQDNAPYIISNPSNFEINEKDFEVSDKED